MNIKRAEKGVRIRVWRHTREIKRRISGCVQRYTLRNTKYYKCDENSDLSATYLGKVDTSKIAKLKQKNHF